MGKGERESRDGDEEEEEEDDEEGNNEVRSVNPVTSRGGEALRPGRRRMPGRQDKQEEGEGSSCTR